MVVRVKLGSGRRVAQRSRKNRHLAFGAAALLAPISLMAYVLGLWRLAADLGVAGEFTIQGIFSHWQVWMAIAVAAHASAVILNRYGRGDEQVIPTWLVPSFSDNVREYENSQPVAATRTPPPEK